MLSKMIFSWLLACILAVTALVGTLQGVQASGGPDDGGYIYEDSLDPGGPVYSWDDISTTGTALSLANDAMSAAIPVPFPFTFYGTAYNSVYVSSNGFLTFLSGQPNANTPAAIPTASTPNAMIAGYWANLNPRFLLGGASIRYQVLGDTGSRRMVVAFIGVPHNGDSYLSPARSTFEFKLFEGTNNIEVHYNSMTSNGGRHVAGIENAAGTAGLSYFDDPADAIPNSSAVRFKLFTGVAVRPTYDIKYGPPGSMVTFTQRVANWTGAASTFSLTPSGSTWTTRVLMGAKDFRTTALAQGESAPYTVEVDIPSNAVPGNSSQMTIKIEGNGYSDTSTLVAAVPKRGYGLGYYAVDSDNAYSAIMPLDTTFHNSLHEAIDGTNLGPFLYFGAAIRPDLPELWVVSSSAQSDTGETVPPKVYAIPIDSLGNLTMGSLATIDLSIDASDIAFTPDGRTAVVTGYGAGTAAFIDTATRTVIGSTISTGANSLQIATAACIPNKAYVTNNGTSGAGANTVSVINISGQSLIKNITGFSQPSGVVISPTASRAFITNNGNGSIGVIDTQTDTLIATWTNIGSGLAGIDITPDGSRLYVAADTDVKVVNASSGALITTIPTTVDSLYDLKVFSNAAGTYAYATSRNSSVETVQVIDTATNTIIKQMADDWNSIGLALFPMQTQCATGPVAPVASFTPQDTTIRVNESVAWTNTSSYNPTSYVWNFGDDSSTSSETNPTHTYAAVGTFTVTLTASNSAGSSAAAGTVKVLSNDTTPPNVTINQAAGQADPTTASPIQFSVVFNEAVQGFEAADVVLSGSSGATTASVSGGPAEYTVSVSGMTGTGTVIATIPANAATDSGGNGNTASTSTDNQVTYNMFPDLTVTKSHTGNFAQGQMGAQYLIAVSNAGNGPTSGAVTVVDTLPAGLTATAMSGTGWTCTVSTLTCTRSNALASGGSYPNITLTANVASDAPASVTNSAAVSGGSDGNPNNNAASDPTTIVPASAVTSKIVPTGTTCSQFVNGTASQLSESVYTVSSGRIRMITPSSFIYYTKVVANATTLSISVQQSNTLGWPAVSASQISAYKASCATQYATIRTGTAPTIQISNATVGATYYIAVRYSLTGLNYRLVTSPYPTVTYTYITTIGGTQVSNSAASVKIRPQ